MPIYQVVVLAIVQALTEFLPISSTAHLVLIPWLFGWKDGGLTFDVALHAGTLVAVIIYFFQDWVQIIGQGFGLNSGSDPELKQNRNLLWLLAVASIPIGIVGYLVRQAGRHHLAPALRDRHHADRGRHRDVDRRTPAHRQQIDEHRSNWATASRWAWRRPLR